MDKDEVIKRMHDEIERYAAMPYPQLARMRRRYECEIAELHRRESMFYATMAYYEDMLETMPVAVAAAEQSTTVVVPYQPQPPRRRGRPPTGVKPRDRRVHKDNDEY